MSQGCSIGFGQNFDLGLCITSTLIDMTPDWLVPLLPYWPVGVIVVGTGLAYRFAGAPGLAAFAAAVGFILGRRSAVKSEDQYNPEPPPPSKPKRKGL